MVAYGFIAGSRSSGYNPHAFGIGASFLFAAACVALVTLSIRVALDGQATSQDRPATTKCWPLDGIEGSRGTGPSLFEFQADLIVLRDPDGCITFVNDADCELAQQPRSALIGSHFSLDIFSSRANLPSSSGRTYDQKIATPLGPRWIAWREGLVRTDAGQPADQPNAVGRDVTDRTESERALGEVGDQADAANRAKSRFLADGLS